MLELTDFVYSSLSSLISPRSHSIPLSHFCRLRKLWSSHVFWPLPHHSAPPPSLSSLGSLCHPHGCIPGLVQGLRETSYMLHDLGPRTPLRQWGRHRKLFACPSMLGPWVTFWGFLSPLPRQDSRASRALCMTSGRTLCKVYYALTFFQTWLGFPSPSLCLGIGLHQNLQHLICVHFPSDSPQSHPKSNFLDW